MNGKKIDVWTVQDFFCWLILGINYYFYFSYGKIKIISECKKKVKVY